MTMPRATTPAFRTASPLTVSGARRTALTLSSTVLVSDPMGVLSDSSKVVPVGATSSCLATAGLEGELEGEGAPGEGLDGPGIDAGEVEGEGVDGGVRAGGGIEDGPGIEGAGLDEPGFEEAGPDGAGPDGAGFVGVLDATAPVGADSIALMVDRGMVTVLPSATLTTTASGRAAISSPTTAVPSVRTTRVGVP
jgi:hypothetical protein